MKRMNDRFFVGSFKNELRKNARARTGIWLYSFQFRRLCWFMLGSLTNLVRWI
jgi:hypothetical protein